MIKKILRILFILGVLTMMALGTTNMNYSGDNMFFLMVLAVGLLLDIFVAAFALMFAAGIVGHAIITGIEWLFKNEES